MNVPWMGRYGAKVFDQGYRIVPLQPKAKRPIDKDWERNARLQNEADVEKLGKERRYCGIGILTACNPAVDIDVQDAELAMRFEQLAYEKLGRAPVRIGAPPKRLLVYRTDVPFHKLRSRAFTLPGDKPGDKAHQIEILGNGQQFVAYGIHPGTGRPYDWPEDSPLDIAADDLMPITVEQVRSYIEAAEALLIAAGGKPAAGMAEDTGPRKPNAKLTADFDLIADAIATVPNHGVHYDDWVAVGMALKAAVGERGNELFHGYSQKSSKYDAEATNRTWNSLKPDRIGAGSIFHWAKMYGGWTRPASAASRNKAEVISPYWSRPTLEAMRGSRKLNRIIAAFLNEVERRRRCRDRVDQLTAERLDAIPDGLPDDARSKAERRIRARATRQAMREFKLHSWRNPRVQIKAPAGLGKSTAIRAEYLRRRELWRCHVHVYVPDLRLAEAFKEAVDEQIAPGMAHNGHGPRTIVMYGRTRGLKTGTAKCLRPEMAAAVEGKVGSTYQAICCSDKAECSLIMQCRLAGYLAQYEDRAPAMRIFPHAHLGLRQPEELQLPKPDLVIIDEGCIDALREQLEVPLDWLADPRVYGKPRTLAAREYAFIGSLVADAIREGGLEMDGLRRAGLTVNRLREAAAGAKQAAEGPNIIPDTPLELTKSILADAGPLRGPLVAAALEQLAGDLEKGRKWSVSVEYIAQHSGMLDGQLATFSALFVHRLRELSVHLKTALCLIDADADAAINQTVFGPLRCFELAVRRRGHVTQCDSTILAKKNLLWSDRELDKISRLVSRKVSEQVFDPDLRAFRPKGVLVVLNKPVRVKVTGETGDRLDLAGRWHGAEVTHFGAFLGQNRWEKFDVVIIVGREQIPPLAAERMARAVYANADVDLTLAGEYIEERRGYDLRDGGSVGADVRRHPDDRVQTFVELKRERSMAQAVDRLRLLHPDGRSPEVIILCNIPLPGVAVDCLMSLDDICDGGTPLARAFRETAGAMPLMPTTLAHRHRDLFTSPAAAESVIRREDLETVRKQIEPICNPTVSRFRRKPNGRHGGDRRLSPALLAADSLVYRGLTSLAVGSPLIWEHPPTGARPGAPEHIQALATLLPGERLMHRGREMGRIGMAGIPLPTSHYHLDDEFYPVRIGEHGDVFWHWYTWAAMLQWLPKLRMLPPVTSIKGSSSPDSWLSTPKSNDPIVDHCIFPAARTTQQNSYATA